MRIFRAAELIAAEIPLAEIGARAMGVLCACIEQNKSQQPKGEEEIIVLPTRFVVRESSASLKALVKPGVLAA